MNASKKAVLLMAVYLTGMVPVRADVNSDMQSMFNSLGVLGNYTSPTAFVAQGQGYFLSGGGVVARLPNKSITPINFERPSFSAGCGGIDIHLGSLSFAGVQEYVEFFKALPQATLGYGLKVGLDAISPTLRKAFDSVEEGVNRVNSYAMNSCAMAQSLVNGAMGEIEVANLERCKSRKMAQGKDAAKAEILCKQSEGAEKPGDNPDGIHSLEPIDSNVVWTALGKINGLSVEDRELMMSIFGTVVINSSKVPKAEPTPFEPTIPTFRDFFYGKPYTVVGPNIPPTALTLYKCDEPVKCMEPKKELVPLRTFPVLVDERMRAIADNLLTGTRQSEENIGFINGTPFPVFRMLVLATGTGNRTVSNSFIYTYKDLIAIELAVAYIDKIVSEATAIMKSAQHSLSTSERELLNNIAQVGQEFKRAAKDEERSLSEKIQARQNLKTHLEDLQKTMYERVPENVRRLMAVR